MAEKKSFGWSFFFKLCHKNQQSTHLQVEIEHVQGYDDVNDSGYVVDNNSYIKSSFDQARQLQCALLNERKIPDGFQRPKQELKIDQSISSYTVWLEQKVHDWYTYKTQFVYLLMRQSRNRKNTVLTSFCKAQRHIQNPVKHLRWSILLTILAKHFISDVSQSSE